ncbi:hypothetical protein ANN_09411 [Periplaneta americana]|uniref:Reverse transcriptase domain-containing protein n=1 Tax=Periplaneta americana TaxID=6978 RepID=A0ABQ8TLK6_PERAM|nr:hypothetical protein ANN_09411 [Periplaneta americana]
MRIITLLKSVFHPLQFRHPIGEIELSAAFCYGIQTSGKPRPQRIPTSFDVPTSDGSLPKASQTIGLPLLRRTHVPISIGECIRLSFVRCSFAKCVRTFTVNFTNDTCEGSVVLPGITRPRRVEQRAYVNYRDAVLRTQEQQRHGSGLHDSTGLGGVIPFLSTSRHHGLGTKFKAQQCKMAVSAIHNDIADDFQELTSDDNDNTVRLELNGIHQLFVYEDDVNMFGESPQMNMENTEILLEASKAIGLEVNPETTKYKIMSRDQNIIRNGNIKIGDLSFEEVKNFKYYLGATVTNINYIREEIKHRINMGNGCYYSVI